MNKIILAHLSEGLTQRMVIDIDKNPCWTEIFDKLVPFLNLAGYDYLTEMDVLRYLAEKNNIDLESLPAKERE